MFLYPCSLLQRLRGPGWFSCTSTDLAQGKTDHEHPDVQSHRWAKVNGMTVLLHGAQHRLESDMWLSPTNRQLNLPGDLWAPG